MVKFLLFLLLIPSVFAYCGNDYCEANENSDTCMSDCPIDITSAASCLVDKCDGTMQYHFKNFLILIAAVALIIYFKETGWF